MGSRHLAAFTRDDVASRDGPTLVFGRNPSYGDQYFRYHFLGACLDGDPDPVFVRNMFRGAIPSEIALLPSPESSVFQCDLESNDGHHSFDSGFGRTHGIR